MAVTADLTPLGIDNGETSGVDRANRSSVASERTFQPTAENVGKVLSGREAADPFQEEIGICCGDPLAGGLVLRTEPLFKEPEQSLGLSLLSDPGGSRPDLPQGIGLLGETTNCRPPRGRPYPEGGFLTS